MFNTIESFENACATKFNGVNKYFEIIDYAKQKYIAFSKDNRNFFVTYFECEASLKDYYFHECRSAREAIESAMLQFKIDNFTNHY